MEHLSSFDGTQIAYEVMGEEAGDSAVLLHHGFASTSAINWVRPGLADALVSAGRRVVLVDARGHGESDHPHDPAAYAGNAMARDVSALADHLGLATIDMAGYSMGAFVTIHVAGTERRLRSIFLGGIGTGQVRTNRGETVRAIIEAFETDEPSTIENVSAKAFRNFADATGQDRLALAAIQRASSGLDPDTVSRITLPTVVVNGDRDTLIGDPGSVAALISHAKSVVVPGDHISAVVKPEFRQSLVGWATS
jgi:pimeloyl-ACP methyl ester carboxylesterase